MVKLLRDRPLFTVCFFFSITYILSFRLCSGTVKLCLAALVPVGIFLVLIKKLMPIRARYIKIAPLVLIIFGIGIGGLFSYIRYEAWVDKTLSYTDTQAQITARIDKVQYQADYSSAYVVTVKSINGKEVSIPAVLELTYSLEAQTSDTVSGDVVFSIPDEMSGLFPLREHYASKGILLIASSSDTLKLSSGDTTLKMKFEERSDRISSKLRLILGDDVGGLASGILLGRRDAVADNVKRDFNIIGVSHLLAVSGLHLSVLIGALELILRLLGIGKWFRFGFDVSFCILFLFITGFPASCIRASIMLLFVLLSSCLGNDSDSATSLSVASVIILVLFRGAVYDVGFMLSFSATFGIITFGGALSASLNKHIHGKSFIKSVIRKNVSLISVSFAAMIFTLPVLWVSFGQLSAVSIISNIIFVPLVSVMLYGIIITLLLSKTVFVSGIAVCVKRIGDLILFLAADLCRISPDPISLRYDFVKYGFIAAALALIVILVLSMKKTHIFASVLIPFAVFVTVFGAFYTVTYFNSINEVSIITANRLKNDFLLIHENGETILCDFSDGTYTSPKMASELSPTVFHDTSFDTLYLTHYHTKHISSFVKLADNYHLKRVCLPKPDTEDSEYICSSLESEARKRKIEVVLYEPDTYSDIGSVSLKRSELCYIKRSTQPIFCLSVKSDSDIFVYTEGAIFESSLHDTFASYAENASEIAIGIHGPNIKNQLDNRSVLDGRHIFVTSDSVNDALGTNIESISSDEISYTVLKMKH